MTDEQIIKALECCTAHLYVCGDGCPLPYDMDGEKAGCRLELCENALHLINKLKEEIKHHEKAGFYAEKAFKLHEEETKLKDKEIEILIRKKEALKDEIAEKDAEIDRQDVQIMNLKHEIERMKDEQ